MKKYFILAAAAMMFVACGSKKEEQAQNADDAPQVKVATVSAKVLPQEETYTATVESDVKNDITPNVAYRIEHILVDVGDRVSKGQCLVQLDEASLQQLQLQVSSQKISLGNYKTEYGRMEQLYKVGGISKAEYDNAKVAYETQLNQLNVLKSQLALMSRNTKLYAPTSGYVTARNYDDGDMYNGTPILTIEQTGRVKIVTDVSEEHYKDVHLGQTIDITLDAYPGGKFVGKVTTIAPSVNETTHTFAIEITIQNQNQKVRPGMFARATVNFGSASHVLIPDVALVKQIGAGDRYVYVYDPQKQTVSYNKVDLGKHYDSQYEILSGVSDGQKVVVAGQSRLSNGKKVKVVK